MLSVEQEFRLTVSGTLGTKTFQKHRGYETMWKGKHTDVKSEREIQGCARKLT